MSDIAVTVIAANESPRLRELKRRQHTALAELLEQRFTGHGDQLALAAIALANGLAIEELSDPGSIPDELLGNLVATLVQAEPLDQQE